MYPLTISEQSVNISSFGFGREAALTRLILKRKMHKAR